MRGRQWAFVVASALLVVGAVQVSGAPDASATTKPKFVVSASTSTTTVALGAKFTVTGAVAKAPIGSRVRIQYRVGTGWRTWATAKITAAHRYSVSLPAGSIQRMWTLRVIKPHSRTRATGASPWLRVYATDAKFASSIALTRTTAAVGDTVGVSGLVSPAVRGVRIALRQWHGGSSVLAARTTTDADGRWSLTAALNEPGGFSFTAEVGASGLHLNGVSELVAVTVRSDRLAVGQALYAGDSLSSADGRYELVMQHDGNLVEYVKSSSRPIWSSATTGTSSFRLVMQADGNLVIYDRAGKATWASHKGGVHPTFVVQGDANLVVYGEGGALWASSTPNTELAPGETLSANQSIGSADGSVRLVMQFDGNLVLYNASNQALWSTGHNATGNWAVMQGDGNLVLYNASNQPLWSTGTAGHSGAVAVLQNDHNFVVYQSGTALWSSNTASGGGTGLTLGSWPGTSGPRAANQFYGYPYPNSPQCTAGAQVCIVDAWNMYQGQCTSWVAYRLNQLNGFRFTNQYGGKGNWGDATHWGAQAGALGIAVNGTPAVGAVAWYASGHVAYVEQVLSSNTVVISEMNFDYGNGFKVHTISTASGWPTGFIHVHDR